MGFTIEPQQGEEIYLIKEHRSAHGHVFALGISNQAVYVPAQKFAVRGDPWYFKRVPLSNILEIRLEKQKSISINIFAAVMIVFGAITTYLMMGSILNNEEGWVSGWPIAIVVGGFLLPFIARSRQTLIVKMTTGKYKWKPQFAVDKESRGLYANIQNEVLQASKKVGIRTIEL